MEYSSECGMSVRQVMKRTVVTSTTTTSSGIESDRGNRSLVEMTTKQAPGFPRHDVKMFARDEFSTMSSGPFSNGRNSYGSVYERSFTTTTIGGGGESRRFIEHITKPSGRGDEHPIVLVRKERSQIDVPEWMEERKSPNAERRGVDISSLKAFLKYPSDYSLRKRKPEADRVNESKIRPEVAKLDKTEIPMILDDDDEEEEESDEEYDEFEEEIVIVDIRRKPIWRKGLEIPKPQPQKAGVPIEDLLEIPTLKAKQESAPDKLIDEKIDSTERPPVVYAELPDFGVLENL